LLANTALRPQRVTAEESGGVWCFQIRKCTGDGGCTKSGSIDGCSITCGDNSSVNCGVGNDDELN
jgi:hypothetical protein